MPPKPVPKSRPPRRHAPIPTDVEPPTGISISCRVRTRGDAEEAGVSLGGASAVAFARESGSVFVTVHRGGHACLWLYPQCHLLRTISTPGSSPVAAAVSDAGSVCALVLSTGEMRVVSFGGDVLARTDLGTGKMLGSDEVCAHPQSGCGVAAFVADTPGSVIAGGAAGLWAIDWKAAGGVSAAIPISGDVGAVTALAGVRPGRLGRGGGAWLGVAGTEKGGVALLTAAAVLTVVPMAHEAAVTAAALSPDGQSAATVCRDGTVVLWRTKPLTPQRQVPGSACGVSISSDSRLLAIAEERNVRVIRLRDARRRPAGEDASRGTGLGTVRLQGDQDRAKLEQPCAGIAFVPFALHRQYEVLKDPDFRSSLVVLEGDGVATFECRDYDAVTVSRPVLLFLILIFAGAAFLTWLIP